MPFCRALDRLGILLACALAVVACTSSAGEDEANDGGKGGSSSGGKGGRAGNGSGGSAGTVAASGDPGFVGLRRLANREYDRTAKDLLGVSSTPASNFLVEEALGFDNVGSALGMTTSQLEQYLNAAEGLADATFADDKLKARIMTCTPSGAGDSSCLGDIVKAFGARAWRRPLADDEVSRLVKLAGEAFTAGEDATGAVKHVVKTMLVSVPFLYRIERDPDLGSRTAHSLDGYEMASRLSYLLWASMPDETLFRAAADGKLAKDDELTAQVERMLGDGRADGFIEGFAGQWLGFTELSAHQVEPQIFPAWNDDLRASMIGEGKLYFRNFLDEGGNKLTDFFTSKMGFVDGPLSKLYGVSAPSGGGAARVDNVPHRQGFLGLSAFLTHTSFSHRTSPTKRGVWILSNLLCDRPSDPPPNVPQLDQQQTQMANAIQNVRDRLAAHRTNPACASCHKLFDPVGLGLENFDAIGAYRDKYANGDSIDPAGTLPDGRMFSGLGDLADILTKDERFPGCVAHELFVYAHGRDVEDADGAPLSSIVDRWKQDGLPLRGLVRQIVLASSFRNRRAEGTP